MSQKLVLVVDPSTETIRRVQEALAESDYMVVSAKDSHEARTIISSEKIDLMLSSTSLPRGNGYDLARHLHQEQETALIFLLAGGYEVYNVDRAERVGVIGRISKPFSVGGLRTKLESVLGNLDAAGPHQDAELPVLDVAPVDAAQPEPELSEYEPLISTERIATIIPRNYEEVPKVSVDASVVSPAIERAVLAIIPEVVEVVLAKSLHNSSAFRDLIAVSVDEAVRKQLPEIARSVVAERLAEIEAANDS